MPTSTVQAAPERGSGSPAFRRPAANLPDLDRLPPSAMCTTKQVAALSAFAEITLKTWRRQDIGRGPKVTYVESRPRYLVRDVKAWLGLQTSSHVEAALAHGPLTKKPGSLRTPGLGIC